MSYSHFDGRTPYQCGGQHHYINFADQTKMTYHHNRFDTTSGRNPKLGGALTQAHSYTKTSAETARSNIIDCTGLQQIQ